MTHTLTTIAGLEIALFGVQQNPNAPVVFITHGLGSCMTDVFENATDLAARGFIVVALDQRNHGRRFIDRRPFDKWNPAYPAAMFPTIVGTAMDVKLLIDSIPVVLGISTERCGMTGFSMGGHATLLSMAMDSRIYAGVPMGGSGDFLMHMELRAKKNGTPMDTFEKEYLSDNLRTMVKKYDPICNLSGFADRPLLMLNGGADTVVYPAPNQTLEAALRPLYTKPERLEMRMYDGVEHYMPTEMWEAGCAWLKKWLL